MMACGFVMYTVNIDVWEEAAYAQGPGLFAKLLQGWFESRIPITVSGPHHISLSLSLYIYIYLLYKSSYMVYFALIYHLWIYHL